jgi:hypothetical protein
MTITNTNYRHIEIANEIIKVVNECNHNPRFTVAAVVARAQEDERKACIEQLLDYCNIDGLPDETKQFIQNVSKELGRLLPIEWVG